MINPMKVPNPT